MSEGRPCRVRVLPFGETVWCIALRETKQRAKKLEAEWAEGIWLGHARQTNDTLIGTPGKVAPGIVFPSPRRFAVTAITNFYAWQQPRAGEMLANFQILGFQK